MVKVFISYSRSDETAVWTLTSDIERARIETWVDNQLVGGDAWWTEILKRIRGADVFVFAASDTALRSKPCRAERKYAADLGIPVLPVQVGDVTSFRNDPLFATQLIDYRNGSENAIDLVSTLYQLGARTSSLPDPLPEPPVIPYAYLHRLGETIRNDDDLSSRVQRQLFLELAEALDVEEDTSVVDDIKELLREIRRRPDVTFAIGSEIDLLLGGTAPSPGEPVKPPRNELAAATAEVPAPTDYSDEDEWAPEDIPLLAVGPITRQT